MHSLLGWPKSGNRLQIKAPIPQCVQKVSEHPWGLVEKSVQSVKTGEQVKLRRRCLLFSKEREWRKMAAPGKDKHTRD